MKNQTPLEMQNPGLNKNLPPHISARAHCVFCGADLAYSVQACPSCGAQAEHAPEPAKPVYDDSAHTAPYKDPAKPQTAPQRTRPTPVMETPKGNKAKFIVAAVVLILIIIIAVLKF